MKDDDANRRARHIFFLVFGVSLALKLLLAAVFPLTGDEALFIQWGLRPEPGYYDHPPLIGWWLALMLQLSDALGWLRLLSVVETHLLAVGLVWLARLGLSSGTHCLAWWAGTAYLALPWSMLFVLVTTDSPLVLLAAVSMACYLWADLRRSPVGYAAAGVALGLAFLSKYLAVLVGIAYAVHVLRWRRERWRVLPGMVLMTLPAVAWNLFFNATHGWPNILFNLFNRHGEAAQFQGLQYLGMVVYLLTPWMIFLGGQPWRRRRAPDLSPNGSSAAMLPPTGTPQDRDRLDLERASFLLWAVPLTVFALVSLRREVGLHWLLAFVPPFVLWVAMRTAACHRLAVRPLSWPKAIGASLALSALHVLLAFLIALSPLGWSAGTKWHERRVFLREAGAVVEALQRDLPAGTSLFALGYSQAATLAYHHGRAVPVFGQGSRYARQDDLWFDFRTLEGRDLRIFSRDAIKPSDFEPYFAAMEVGRIDIAGATFHWLDGKGFRFAPYRERVLSEVQRLYHQIPPWLPIVGSPYCDRYGFAACASH